MPDGWRKKLRELFPGELEYWFPDWRQFYEPVRPLAEAGKRALTWGQPKVTKPLQPWEVAEAAGPGPYWVDKYPDPPYELYGGWDWKKITHPTGRQEWVKYDKQAEAQAEAQAAMKAGWGARPPLSEEELIRLQQAPEWARIELARQAAAAARAPETLTPWQRAQLEQQERRVRAGELARPENWIERWFYENMPAQRPPWTILEAGPVWERGVPGQVPTGYSPVPVTGGVAYVAPGEELEEYFGLPESAFGAGQPSEVAAREEAGLPAHIVTWGAGDSGASPQAPQAPPAPSWLPTFVPGLEVGKPITKQPALTVSGQQAQQITPEQWQGLSGYLGWAGVPGQAASLQDYIARMEAMYPGAQARRPQWGRTRSYV